MKYILEIKPEYEDSFKGVMILGTKDSNLFVDTLAVENLEELNSDYINEHYGSLQDDAYKRGVNDGSLDVKERVDCAYQQGFEDGKAIHEKGCEGCKYEGGTAERNPCFSCSNYYQNYWAAKDDKIVVGDEVTDIQSGANFLVTHLWESNRGDKGVSGFNRECSAFQSTIDKVKKTGRHFDIGKILEEMRND